MKIWIITILVMMMMVIVVKSEDIYAVHGLCFIDSNGNTLYDGAVTEPGVEGVIITSTVLLPGSTDPASQFADDVVTASPGAYQFDNVRFNIRYEFKFYNPVDYYFVNRNTISYTCNMPIGQVSTSLANCLRTLSPQERIGMKANLLASGITAFQVPMASHVGVAANSSVVTLVVNIIPPSTPPTYNVYGQVFYDRFAWDDVYASQPLSFQVTLRVYDSKGTLMGTLQTSSDGKYYLTLLRDQSYKVVFTLPSDHVSTGSSTTVFVNSAMEYSIGVIPRNMTGTTIHQAIPVSFATSCFVVGKRQGPNANDIALVSFKAGASGNAYDRTGEQFMTKLSKHSQIGSVSGIVYEPTSRFLYAAAFWKASSDFGPAGPCGIYEIDPINGAATIYADLSLIYGDTRYCGPLGNHVFDNLTAELQLDLAYRMSFGSMTTDYRYLYVTNLYQRLVNVIPLFEKPTSNNVRSIPVPNPGCAVDKDWRIFAINHYNGFLYAGGVCSGESSGPKSLGAYVLRLRGSTWELVVSFPLQWPRGCTNYDGGKCDRADWSAWSAGPDVQQPSLSSIVFDDQGDMILGFRDRLGDNNLGNPAADMLRLCIDDNGVYVLEYRGQCGGVNGYTTSRFGLGGGHFYNTELIGTHHYASSFSVAHAGNGQLIASGYDFANYYTGAIRWFNAATGQVTRGYQLYNSGTTNFQKTFSKSNGLGDVVPIYSNAVLNQLGLFYTGRVYNDSNSNGVQDAGENGIGGLRMVMSVPVPSYCITDRDGYFTFSGKPQSAHTVYVTSYELSRALSGKITVTPGPESDAKPNNGGFIATVIGPSNGGYYFNYLLFGLTIKN